MTHEKDFFKKVREVYSSLDKDTSSIISILLKQPYSLDSLIGILRGKKLSTPQPKDPQNQLAASSAAIPEILATMAFLHTLHPNVNDESVLASLEYLGQSLLALCNAHGVHSSSDLKDVTVQVQVTDTDHVTVTAPVPKSATGISSPLILNGKK